MKRYGLFVAALLSFLVAVLIVVAQELRPARRSPRRQLQEARLELSRLHASKHHKDYMLSIAASNYELPNSAWEASLTEELQVIDSQIKAAEAEVDRLEAEFNAAPSSDKR